ncbi:MAG: hypothetical protein KAT57_12205, partial [Candidatus Lokiarchaeota archaeon]|nr:hypothetical protein [Candidatus Lokiarchaeota archaeon]
IISLKGYTKLTVINLYPSKFSNFSCFSMKLTIESLKASLLEVNPLKFRTFSNLSNRSSLIWSDIIGIYLSPPFFLKISNKN